MDDLIDRQAAIDAFAGFLRDIAKIDNPSLPMVADGWTRLAEDILCKVPSAQPEIIRCKDCEKQPVCRFAQYQGNDGYCSLAERKGEQS